MINSIGLPNKGLEGFLAAGPARQLAELPVPLIVSVMATSHESSRGWSRASAGRDEVAALELNVSCPNVESGLIVGEQPGRDARAARGCCARSPTEAADREAHPQRAPTRRRSRAAAEAGGADAVSLINTLKATALDPATPRALARGGQRRPLGPGDPRDRARAGARGSPARCRSGDRDGRDRVRGRRARVPRRRRDRGRGRHRELPRSAGRDRGSGPSSRRLSSGRTRHRLGPAGRGSPALRPQPKVEANFAENRADRPCAPQTRVYNRRRRWPPSVDTAAAVPERTHEQRMRALRRANEIRSARAQLKRDLKAGKVEDRALLLDPPDYVHVGEGVRHDPRGPQVRPREGEQDPHPVPDLAVEDDRRPLRAPARRARRVPPPVALRRRPRADARRTGFVPQGASCPSVRIGAVAKVFVITGPSGVGKGTLIGELLRRVPGLELSVSATTRRPRDGEVDGRDYHFLDREEFDRARPAGRVPRARRPTAATATGRCAPRSSGGWPTGARWSSRSRSRAPARCARRCRSRSRCSSRRRRPRALRERLEGRGTDSAERDRRAPADRGDRARGPGGVPARGRQRRGRAAAARAARAGSRDVSS